MRNVFAALILSIGLSACGSLSPGRALQADLDTLQAQHPDSPGFAIYVIAAGDDASAATGIADPDGTAFSAQTPVRIASITKTFVAASVLRLAEDGQLDLNQSVDGFLSPEVNELLQSDRYDTDRITLRHLLMHASGMADHANETYIERVFADPEKVWTPREQIEMLVTSTDPVGEPGEAFSYSDTGYVLLGQVLTKVTEQPLHVAVRELLGLDQLDLSSLYWDEAESPRPGAPARAHQFAFGQDISGFHGTLDAHGGGGMVASAKDVARLYRALFDGVMFDQPATLEVMKTAPGHPDQSPYRLGLFTFEVAGYETFQHSGFWGTNVIHVPELDLTIAGVALNQDGFRDLRSFMHEVIQQRAEPADG